MCAQCTGVSNTASQMAFWSTNCTGNYAEKLFWTFGIHFSLSKCWPIAHRIAKRVTPDDSYHTCFPNLFFYWQNRQKMSTNISFPKYFVCMHVVWCGVLVLFYFILYFFRLFFVFIFSALYGINAIAYMQAAQPNQSITQMCANKKISINIIFLMFLLAFYHRAMRYLCWRQR